MSIGSLTLDFLHSRYKCTTVLLTKISPVAAAPCKSKEIRSNESELSTSGPLRIYRLRR